VTSSALPGDPVRIGVALGGGAVRGAAHIGVLAALDDAGLAPSVVTGTSAGAIVGGLYSAGMSPRDIAALATRLRWMRLVHPTMKRRSLLDTTRLLKFLDDALGGKDFGDLDRTFAAVACELTSGARIVLDRGPVAEAMLASAAIPGVFPPVGRGGDLLVDGGLVDLVPAALARSMGADVVVAVDVSGPLPRRAPRTMLQILVAATHLQTGVAEALARDADVVLSPALDEFAFWELSRIPEFERAGWEAAKPALPVIRALCDVVETRRRWQHATDEHPG
jgi:NTE family protein